MNCKPGDLAIVVKSLRGNEGKIVKCVTHFVTAGGNDAWYTEPPITNANGICDFCLRPIRDSDGEDEMLRIAGKPANYKGKVVTTKPAKLDELK